MRSKRHQILIGTGLVAAISCGMTPTPASAFGVEAPADSRLVAVSESSPVSVSQTVIPNVARDGRDSMRIRLTNNTATPTAKGATFEIKLPSGVLWRKDEVKLNFSTGYNTGAASTVSADYKTMTVNFGYTGTAHGLGAGEYVDIVANFASPNDNTRSGLVADGSFTVTAGAAFPVGTTASLAYEAPAPAVSVSQTVIPKVAPHANGSMRIRLTNNDLTPTAKGGTFELKSPSGTLWRKDEVKLNFSTGYNTGATPTVSADHKTMTVNFGYTGTAHGLGAGEYVDIVANFAGPKDNTRSGLVTDGSFTVTGGAAFPVGATTPLAYEAVAPAVSVSQTVIPKVAPHANGSMRIRLTNNDLTPTAAGGTFELKSPSGTLWRKDEVKLNFSTGYNTGAASTVSADNKTMTVNFGYTGTAHGLGAGQYVDVVANFYGPKDNTRVGLVTDGSFTVTGGAAFPVGATTTLAYEAQAAAVALNGPAVGAIVTDSKRPVFSGTGQPGSQITVTGSSGRVVATTMVKADSTWSVPATFDLVNGKYSGTVTQGIDGSSARYDFSLNYTAPKVEIVPVAVTSPTKNEQLLAGKPKFAGKGQPGATVSVAGRYGTVLGTGVVKANGSWEIESLVSLNVGSYAVIATQKVDGNVSSAEVEFTAVEPGSVTLTGPAIDAVLVAGKPVFSGTGKAGASVVVQGRFGTILAQTTVAADGKWSVESTVSLAPGSYAGLVKQDANGKVTTAPFQFTAK